MTRSELIRLVARNTELSQAKVSAVVKNLMEEIAIALKDSGRVDIFELGSFTVQQKEKRMFRNPNNGKPVEVGPRKVLKYKIHKTLKDFINS